MNLLFVQLRLAAGVGAAPTVLMTEYAVGEESMKTLSVSVELLNCLT
jgi:hypothetical protein